MEEVVIKLKNKLAGNQTENRMVVSEVDMKNGRFFIITWSNNLVNY